MGGGGVSLLLLLLVLARFVLDEIAPISYEMGFNFILRFPPGCK